MRRAFHGCLLPSRCPDRPSPRTRSTFWDTPQRGTNCFKSAPPDAAYFQRAAGLWRHLGAAIVQRMEISADGRDFSSAVSTSIKVWCPRIWPSCVAVLDIAQAAGIKWWSRRCRCRAARWIQQNNDKFDDRLWSDKRYWKQSAAFWRDLAACAQGSSGRRRPTTSSTSPCRRQQGRARRTCGV